MRTDEGISTVGDIEAPQPARRSLSVPPAPVVSAALSGFVVGILITLLATGVFTRRSSTTTPPATARPVVAVSDSQMETAVRRIVVRQLGPGVPCARGGTRLCHLYLLPAECQSPRPRCSEALSSYRSVVLAFRLLNHPLGRSWRLRVAKGDVFQVMKALYASQLPIYSVDMRGYFPRKVGNKFVLRPALEAFMDHEGSLRIPWKRWQRDREGTVWRLLSLSRVQPWFA